MLVGADALAALSARQVATAGCSGTTQVSIVAPVFLGAGGFLVLVALATRLATTGAEPRSGRPRWGMFLALWVVVVIAFAVSGFVLYFASTFRLCA